jgi:phosphomannomutase
MEFLTREQPKTLCLFDVDGTLTPARQSMSPTMRQLLQRLKQKVVVGFVGGSDLAKQKEQLGEDCLQLFDYAFSENGLTAYRLGQPLLSMSFKDYLGEDRLKRLINFMLRYLADLELPLKRGTFIEFRKSMLNVSPIGRNCSQEERDEFEKYDFQEGIRKQFVKVLQEKFSDYDLTFSIGGQISFDVFPRGWDKTYCLRHLETDGFDTIHFFGDKTMVGGNDYELYTHPRVIGHTVRDPLDTMTQLHQLFFGSG